MDAPTKPFTEADYDITYHPDREEFELITSLQEHVQGIGAAEVHLWLPASLIREMVELLPPSRPEQPFNLPPEAVH